MTVSMNGIYRSFQRVSHEDLLLWYFNIFPRVALVSQSGVQKNFQSGRFFISRFVSFLFLVFHILYFIFNRETHLATCNRSEAKISPADVYKI